MPHRRSGQHFAQEQDHEPAGPLFHQFGQRRLRIREVQPLRTAEFLEVLGVLLLYHIHHIVDRHDAEQRPGGVGYRKRHPVQVAEQLSGHLLVVISVQRDETTVDQVGYDLVRRSQQNFPDVDVVDQLPTVVHHINHIERLGITPETADVLQRLRHGIIRFHGNVFRRHQPTDTIFGVA